MTDRSVFSTAGRTPSAQMDADLSTLHAPEAAAEVVDEGCRRVRERGQIDIVRSATCVDKADQRMAIRRTADIGAKRTLAKTGGVANNKKQGNAVNRGIDVNRCGAPDADRRAYAIALPSGGGGNLGRLFTPERTKD